MAGTLLAHVSNSNLICTTVLPLPNLFLRTTESLQWKFNFILCTYNWFSNTSLLYCCSNEFMFYSILIRVYLSLLVMTLFSSMVLTKRLFRVYRFHLIECHCFWNLLYCLHSVGTCVTGLVTKFLRNRHVSKFFLILFFIALRNHLYGNAIFAGPACVHIRYKIKTVTNN